MVVAVLLVLLGLLGVWNDAMATVALMLASLGLLGLSAGRRKALSGEQA